MELYGFGGNRLCLKFKMVSQIMDVFAAMKTVLKMVDEDVGFKVAVSVRADATAVL